MCVYIIIVIRKYQDSDSTFNKECCDETSFDIETQEQKCEE